MPALTSHKLMLPGLCVLGCDQASGNCSTCPSCGVSIQRAHAPASPAPRASHRMDLAPTDSSGIHWADQALKQHMDLLGSKLGQ